MDPSTATETDTKAKEQGSEMNMLILYVGGTIGMLESGAGYVPCPGFLYDSLKNQSRFHDPFASHLDSHSFSVESYRTWSTSGENTPVTEAANDAQVTPAELSTRLDPSKKTMQSSTLPVATPSGLKDYPALISPRNQQGQRIKYVIYEYEHLIDSSEVDTGDYIRMATDIEKNYSLFDAFLILHGTDTMSYTASTLSFLLQNLGKTVIITGAQIPLSQVRNDAIDNLLGALSIARSYILPEVCLFFNDKLFRGNRTTKSSSFDFDAFSSPNCDPLATIGIDIKVRWDLVLRPKTSEPFQPHKQLCRNVTRLSLYPGITGAIIRAVLAPPIEGCVLESFGSGNCPTRAEIVDALREATDRGVIIVNVSQCARGAVVDKYAAGRHLSSLGIIAGADMTCEAALAKLSHLLARDNVPRSEMGRLIGTPLAGELTPVGAAASADMFWRMPGSSIIEH